MAPRGSLFSLLIFLKQWVFFFGVAQPWCSSWVCAATETMLKMNYNSTNLFKFILTTRNPWLPAFWTSRNESWQLEFVGSCKPEGVRIQGLRPPNQTCSWNREWCVYAASSTLPFSCFSHIGMYERPNVDLKHGTWNASLGNKLNKAHIDKANGLEMFGAFALQDRSSFWGNPLITCNILLWAKHGPSMLGLCKHPRNAKPLHRDQQLDARSSTHAGDGF